MLEFTPDQLKGLALLSDAIAQIAAPKKSIFVEEKTTVLYSNPPKSKTWTFKDGEKYIDAPTRTIEGRITELRYRGYETSGGAPDIRWFLTVSNGFESVIVQSSHGRIFANSMLAAIAQMSVEQIKQTVRVTCSEWEAEKGTAHFCNITVDGQKIDAPRIEGKEINAIATIAQELVAQANGYVYTPKK
jgi:hypothetical protein